MSELEKQDNEPVVEGEKGEKGEKKKRVSRLHLQ